MDVLVKSNGEVIVPSVASQKVSLTNPVVVYDKHDLDIYYYCGFVLLSMYHRL